MNYKPVSRVTGCTSDFTVWFLVYVICTGFTGAWGVNQSLECFYLSKKNFLKNKRYKAFLKNYYIITILYHSKLVSERDSENIFPTLFIYNLIIIDL